MKKEICSQIIDCVSNEYFSYNKLFLILIFFVSLYIFKK